MATVLWHQTYDGDDYVFSRGIDKTKDEHKLVGVLSRYSELAVTPEELMDLRRNGKDISNGIKYLYLKEVKDRISIIFIQSCFEETDKVGRRLSFMFYTEDCETMQSAVEVLKDIAMHEQLTCSADEIDYFESVHDFPMRELLNKSSKGITTIGIGSLIFGSLTLGIPLVGSAVAIGGAWYLKKHGIDLIGKMLND